MIKHGKRATLLLANGMEFEGKCFGREGTAIGEIVFTTAMTGYQETLTDPSYYGHLVVQTFPLIGNYGTNSFDNESDNTHLSGYIVREWCELPSNFRCESTIDTFLKERGVIGIYDIDTRALTKIIRETGVMNGMIISGQDFDREAVMQELREFRITDAVKHVSISSQQHYKAANSKRHVVMYDFGYKKNIKEELLKRDCDVTLVPAGTTAEEVRAMNPDGIMLSNGPGDPEDNPKVVENLKKLLEMKIPTFGICLGHQLMALANGAKTEKLKYGHRGENQPVTDVDRGRTFVTTQNHGYAVLGDSIDEQTGYVSHKNANDGSCEGVRYREHPVFTVQFHPEASGGPEDTAYLFDEFIALMDREGK